MNRILIKQSDVVGHQPSVPDLELGEIAINTTDLKIYALSAVDGLVHQIAGEHMPVDAVDITPAGLDTQIQFNNNGVMGASGSLYWDYNISTLFASNFNGSGSNIVNLDAGFLATGIVPTARLGTGTADDTTFLRGDNTWAVVQSGLAIGDPIAGGSGNGSVLFMEQDITNSLSMDDTFWYDSTNQVLNVEGVAINNTLSITNLSGYIKGTLGVISAQAIPIPPADLGTGTADATTFLRGDSTWAVVSTGTSNVTLTGDVTGTGAGTVPTIITDSAVTTPKIADASVTFPKMRSINSMTLLGNYEAITGQVQEVSLNMTMTMLGGFLGVEPETHPQQVYLFQDGTLVGQQARLNFIEGPNTILTIVDNTTDAQFDITVGTDLTAVLPPQTGHAGEYLTTDGTTHSWSFIAQYQVTNLVTDLALKAPLDSPALTGTPTAPTAVPATDTTQLATTAFVHSQGFTTALTAPVTSVATKTGAVTLVVADVSGAESTAKKATANGYASLDAATKVPLAQLPDAIMGGLNYQGVWDAETNVPPLGSSVGTKGFYYKVSVTGSTDLDGITDWSVGDWAVYNGTTWDKIDNTEMVASVNGMVGVVVLTTTEIAEGTNEYFTTAKAAAAAPVQSVATKTGAVTLVVADVTGAAPLASPALTGTPTAPTAAPGTSTTQVATTAFVVAQGTAIDTGVVHLAGAETITGLKTFTGVVTAGSFAGGGATITNLNATNLATGTVAPPRLGTGTADATTFLRGDNTWQTVSAAPAGSDTRVQFNNNGVFGSDTTFSFDITAKVLSASKFMGDGAFLTNLNATNLASGTVSPSRLGTGTADATTFLSGDSTWVAPPGGTPGGVDTQIQFNKTGAFAGSTGLTWDDTLKGLLVQQGTLNPIGLGIAAGIRVATTWNDPNVKFIAPLTVEITNTASNGACPVFDLKVDLTQVFKVTNFGDVTATGTLNSKRLVVNQATSPTTLVPDAATITYDLTKSNWHRTTLAGNRPLAVTGGLVDQTFSIRLTQAATGTGPFAPTWWAGITWFTANFASPTMPTTPGATMICSFRITGSGTYDGFWCGSSAK